MVSSEGQSGWSGIPLVVVGLLYIVQPLFFEADFHCIISTPLVIVETLKCILLLFIVVLFQLTKFHEL